QRIMGLLNLEGVDTSLMPKGEGRTGFSIVLDAYKHDHTILAFKGSNDELHLSEARLSKMKTKWFYFSSMMGRSYKTIEKLAVWAKKNNTRVMFNPSSYLCRKGKNYLAKLLRNCAILVLNKEEAEMLSQKKKVREMLKTLSRMGPELTIITDGKNGAYLHEKGFYRIKSRKVKVVETTGAGDAFGSSFLGAYIRTGDLELSLKIGMVNAESVIQHVGSKNKLLTWNEAIGLIKKYPNKVQAL
ncbi:MAG: carbohydrate kinase family protein, partial [Candidatus Woesearchaeota archaeon]